MAMFVFDQTPAGRIAFNPLVDVMNISGKASDYVLGSDASGNATLSRGTKTITLFGAPQAALSSANFVVPVSEDKVIIGDNTAGTVNDALAQGTGDVLDLVTANNNTLNANNLIYGMGGGDTITTGNGDNLIFGGRGTFDSLDGSDTFVINGAGATSGSNRIFANAGDDTLLFMKPTGLGKVAMFWGGAGNDEAVSGGATGNLIFYGNAGNDTLNASGSVGTVIFYGGNGMADSTDGADTLITGFGNATVYANAGNDALSFDDFAAVSAQVLYGGLGNDTMQGDVDGGGSGGVLQLYGGAGTDVLDASSHRGIVTVYGGNGLNDSADGADQISISATDTASRAVVYGNGGADTINVVGAMADGAAAAIFAGLGADVVNVSGARGDLAQLTILGNAGNDTYNINDSTLTEDATTVFLGFEKADVANITINGGSAIDFVVTGQGVSLVLDNGVANGKYVFADYKDALTDRNLVFQTGAGSLQVNVGAKATLNGGANNDQLIAGALGDTLNGAGGNDVLRGGDLGDSISGGDGVDTIFGNEGNDTLTTGDGGALGGAFDSLVDGGDGADSITGGLNEDILVGSTGHDTLIGGKGEDTLTGGLGNDVFGYAVADFALAFDEADVIVDAFEGGIDRFTFSDLDKASLRGTGVSFFKGDASAPQVMGANVGLYAATNTVADFSEAAIFAAMSGIADDLLAADKFYAVVSNGFDAYLLRITETTNIGTLTAADDVVDYIAELENVTIADVQNLTAGNFTNFV
jgi:Ca2+-binding RTX toxin-like protein